MFFEGLSSWWSSNQSSPRQHNSTHSLTQQQQETCAKLEELAAALRFAGAFFIS